MELDVINKLRTALSAALSEAQVVYILTLIRKLLDYRSAAPKQLSYLRFFSDWALHVRMDRNGARRVLRHFEEWLPALIKNESRADEGCRFLLLYGFHLEFKWLLREVDLPEITNEWWCEFLRFYLEVIAGSPVSSGADLGLACLQQLMDRANSGRIGDTLLLESYPQD